MGTKDEVSPHKPLASKPCQSVIKTGIPMPVRERQPTELARSASTDGLRAYPERPVSRRASSLQMSRSL